MPARADLTVLIHRHRWWRLLVTLVVVLTATASAQQAIGTLVVTVRGPDSSRSAVPSFDPTGSAA